MRLCGRRQPLGLLLLVATELGLIRLAFAREDHAQARERVSSSHGLVPEPRPTEMTDTAQHQLDEHVAGGTRLRRVPPWPDALDEWLRMCHAAGSPGPRPCCCAIERVIVQQSL